MESTWRAAFDKLEPETFIIITGSELAAAGEAGGSATDAPDPGKASLAVLTAIDKATLHLAPIQRQLMRRSLTTDTQFAAGILPLLAMWQNVSSFAESKLGEQMRQLMP